MRPPLGIDARSIERPNYSAKAEERAALVEKLLRVKFGDPVSAAPVERVKNYAAALEAQSTQFLRSAAADADVELAQRAAAAAKKVSPRRKKRLRR